MRKCRLKQCRTQIPAKKDCTDPITAGGFCGIECLSLHGREKAQAARERKAEREAKAKKKALTEMIRPTQKVSKASKKDYANDHGHQVGITQIVFNRMIRLLDEGKPCISCGRMKCGSYWDAGHYHSVGSNATLRFDPRNCHIQGSACNRANRRPDKNQARKPETIHQEYAIRLREIYGDEMVDWLDGPHPAAHYTIPELKDMRSMMAAECRRLERGEGASRDWRAMDFDWRDVLYNQ